VFVHLFLSEKPWYPYYSLFEAMISTDKTNNIADTGYIWGNPHKFFFQNYWNPKIGKLKHSKDKVENNSWKKQKTIPSQGIYLDHDYIECEQFNWEKKIEKMNKFFFQNYWYPKIWI
jgi:hypothetical protein